MAVMADPLDTCPVTELEIGERGTDGSVEGASSRGLVCENLDGAAFHVLESHRISHACWTAWFGRSSKEYDCSPGQAFRFRHVAPGQKGACGAWHDSVQDKLPPYGPVGHTGSIK